MRESDVKPTEKTTAGAAGRTTVLLADDHSLVRRGFRRILEDDPTIDVVGEASDGAEAVRLARTLKPQVVVMDCAMPGKSGLVATREILSGDTSTAVLMLSMHSEETLVQQALAAGASGYILKSALDLDLAGAVKRVAAGERVIDPALTRPGGLKGAREGVLTPRQLEVLQLICAGTPTEKSPPGSNSASIPCRSTEPILWTPWASTKPLNSSSMRSITDW